MQVQLSMYERCYRTIQLLCFVSVHDFSYTYIYQNRKMYLKMYKLQIFIELLLSLISKAYTFIEATYSHMLKYFIWCLLGEIFSSVLH